MCLRMSTKNLADRKRTDKRQLSLCRTAVRHGSVLRPLMTMTLLLLGAKQER